MEPNAEYGVGVAVPEGYYLLPLDTSVIERGDLWLNTHLDSWTPCKSMIGRKVSSTHFVAVVRAKPAQKN